MDNALTPVGYLVNGPGGVLGNQGVGYDYVLGADGLYVQSQSESLVARIQVAACRVRGLAPVDPKVTLPNGPIPAHLFALGLSWLQLTPDAERFFAISWDGERYILRYPEQSGTASSLIYTPPPDAVAEFHSHGRSSAFFSLTDDEDEQGFRIYGVVGRAGDMRPELNLRLGIYGHFTPLAWSQAFDGPAPGVRLINEEIGGEYVSSG